MRTDALGAYQKIPRLLDGKAERHQSFRISKLNEKLENNVFVFTVGIYVIYRFSQG